MPIECVIAGMPVTSSSVNVRNLCDLIVDHPDRSLVDFLITGFRDGFDIGYRGNMSVGANKNLKSARDNPTHVTEAIKKEVDRGHTLGPFSSPPFPTLHVSPLGAVPKKDGTYRLILNLSSPAGSSVNDGIDEDEFSVKYSSFDEAVELVRTQGKGAFMAKVDIKHAFRNCPVRIQDLPLLGMFWQGAYYIDTRLPFGSRSSPFIFTQFSNMLCWIIAFVCGIAGVIHYLDDFLLVAPNRQQCQSHMQIVLNLFSHLGVPVAMDKLVGPAAKLTYLGIEIDATNSIIRLPADRKSVV